MPTWHCSETVKELFYKKKYYYRIVKAKVKEQLYFTSALNFNFSHCHCLKHGRNNWNDVEENCAEDRKYDAHGTLGDQGFLYPIRTGHENPLGCVGRFEHNQDHKD